MRILWGGLVAMLLSGCLMAGNYHTARTLEKGTSSFGFTFSTTKYSVDYETTDSTGQPVTKTASVAIPNVLPELTYHIGLSDNAEAGGRIAIGSLGGELDFKYRLVHNGKLHLAVAPAIAYQAAFLIEGGGLRLPGILTYELTDNLDFNVAAFVGETHWKPVNDDDDYGVWSGNMTQTGAAVGFDLHGETMSIRPAFEWSRIIFNTDGDNFKPFNTFNVLIHVSFIGGREKKQLDRIERKIDNLQPQPYPPPGGYGPPPQGPPPPPPPPSEPPPAAPPER